MKRALFFLSVLFQLHAKSSIHTGEPWLTGPLLTPTARVIPKGHFTAEPYIFYIVNYGRFDEQGKRVRQPKFLQWVFQVPIRIGLTQKIDLSFTPQSAYSRSQGASKWTLSDLPIGFDFQIYKGDETTLLNNVKLSLIESIPLGKYQKLKLRKFGTDAGGNGAWHTNVGITIGKLIHYGGHHYLSLRMGTYYVLFQRVSVKGLNYYGGDPSTKGKVSPGNELRWLFGAEYTLTKNWALALDLAAFFKGQNRFKGETLLPSGNPSTTSYSIAPAIEYNWSPAMGVIAGSWFTVAGRNAPNFVSFVAAYNYVY